MQQRAVDLAVPENHVLREMGIARLYITSAARLAETSASWALEVLVTEWRRTTDPSPMLHPVVVVPRPGVAESKLPLQVPGHEQAHLLSRMQQTLVGVICIEFDPAVCEHFSLPHQQNVLLRDSASAVTKLWTLQ